MTEEEKKAIADLIDSSNLSLIGDGTCIISNKTIATVLNLINKQQQEIEDMREELQMYVDTNLMKEKLEREIEKLKGIHKEFLKLHQELKAEDTLLGTDNILNAIEKKYISKDKIKEILGIEEDIEEEKLLSLLQTIVDECNRLEDIEDRKVQVEYQNVFNKGVKSVEDKIREKIKELEELKEKYFEKQIIQGRIDLLQELLEE